MHERLSGEQHHVVMWQTQEDGAPEPAILIERYSTSFTIQQEDNRISMNYESIPELIKILKQAHAEYVAQS